LELFIAFLVAGSMLLLAVASLPLRLWFTYWPDAVGHVARIRGPLALIGAATLLGIGAGYLVVLLHLA
jgi:hypothetical protein